MLVSTSDKDRILNDKDLVTLFKAFVDNGYEIRLVGGSVRDMLIGKDIKDIDMAVDATPDEVERILNDIGVKSIPTGKAFGTISAIINYNSYDNQAVLGNRFVEITSLREDIKTDGRHAEVTYTKDWRLDSLRRDLTINALYMDSEGRIYDYVGGQEDLRAGHVKFIGNPQKRIEEDALRVMRFFRFYAGYGNSFDEASFNACLKMAENISNLSGERIRDELFKLLLSEKASVAINLMYDARVLNYVIPSASEATLAIFDKIVNLETRLHIDEIVHTDPVRRLAALIGDDLVMADKVSYRLKLSNKDKKYLVSIIGDQVNADCLIDEHETSKMLHQYGTCMFVNSVLMNWAKHSNINCEHCHELLERAKAWRPLEFPIKGGDVIDAGIEEGREIGDVLFNLEKWWADNHFAPDRLALLNKLYDMVS